MTSYDWTVEAVGWTGGLLILAAYALLSSGRTTGRSPLYQGMNIVGAAGFIVNGWAHGALPSTALNVVWMMIGVATLVRARA